MSSTTEIPADIWLYVARFLSPKTLRDLYSVNRVFLDLSLTERYREVNFLQITRKTLKFLDHLKDPNLSSRVRRLRVNPVWFNLQKPGPGPKTSIRLSLRLLRRIPFDLGRSPGKGIIESIKARRQAIDAATINIVISFTNVTSFVIVTRYFPHPESLPLFLSNSWRTFGANLRRLTINAPLGGFQALLPSPADLNSLEELTLRFSTDMSSEDTSLDTERLMQIITPFLRAVSPKLRTLNIMSSALGDHSGLFALGRLPKLTSLSLDIGFYPPLLLDSSGLTQFFNLNADTLKHIKLQPHECFRSPSVIGPAHDYFAQWMEENAANEQLLSDLETLVVLPFTDPSSPTTLGTACPYIERSKDTLTSLVLGERCMSFAELTLLAETFAHRPVDSGLKTLHVKVVSLNPQVFDLLAKKLVGLDDLDVKFNSLLSDVGDESPAPLDDREPGEEVATWISHPPSIVHSDFEQDIKAFLGEMSKRMYSEWRLYSLWIWQRSHMTTKTAHDILTALQPSIPSVRVIYRMDHTHRLNTIFN